MTTTILAALVGFSLCECWLLSINPIILRNGSKVLQQQQKNKANTNLAPKYCHYPQTNFQKQEQQSDKWPQLQEKIVFMVKGFFGCGCNICTLFSVAEDAKKHWLKIVTVDCGKN